MAAFDVSQLNSVLSRFLRQRDGVAIPPSHDPYFQSFAHA
jgi:hypothetical protein